MSNASQNYWSMAWEQFKKHPLGMLGLYVVAAFTLIGVYAPFLASSKPFVVNFESQWFFPLFRYLFYTGFYTKPLDIFFNLLIFTLPLSFICLRYIYPDRLKWIFLSMIILTQFGLFIWFMVNPIKDPAASPLGPTQRAFNYNWEDDLNAMSPYARLNLTLRYHLRKVQNLTIENHLKKNQIVLDFVPTLWNIDQENERQDLLRLSSVSSQSPTYQEAQKRLEYMEKRNAWLEEAEGQLKWMIMPFIRTFHWQEDAGGQQKLNQAIPWWELSRINRKDLVSALIFGIRISLVVGLTSVLLALLIGIPIGALAGYYGGRTDILVSRLLEIWESMPAFFMLLMVVAVTQSKSIFIIIATIGIFGWTTFSRYIRGEFFKQRNLPYVEACRAIGFTNTHIIFSHILPNAIPPILTLLPFAIMSAITSEAGLSFLGLGEENSASWGVLMDEGRSAFPAESYLLWPPAILLTILLVSIALVGDSLRDALDPKLR